MNDDKKYGVELNLDIKNYVAGLDKAIKESDKFLKSVESGFRDIKITEGKDNVRHLITKAEIDDLNFAAKKAKELNENQENWLKNREKYNSMIKDGTGVDYEALEKGAKQWNEYTEKTKGPVKEYYKPKQLAWFKDLDSNLPMDEYEKQFDKLAEKSQEVGEKAKNSLGDIFKNVNEKAKSSISGLISKISKLKELPSKLGGLTSKLKDIGKSTNIFSNISKSISKGTSNLKRFALSLFGIQTAYRAVSKAVSAYLSYDSDLQQTISNTWAGFGSLLAPVLEYIVGLLQKLLAYLNAVVKAFTGIDMVARANAKAMDKVAKSSKNASKSLASFDEIQNINQPTGNDGSNNQIQMPDVDISGLDDIIEKIKEKIKNGDWYGLGEAIGQEITKALEKINWSSIQAKARKIGTNIAEFINGGIAGTDWSVMGNTIAQGINTAINLVYGFVSTLNWNDLGTAIGTFLSSSINNINWALFAQTISESLKGVLNMAASSLISFNWVQLARSIETLITNIDYSGIAQSIARLIGSALGASISFLGTFIYDFYLKLTEKINYYMTNAGGNIIIALYDGIKDAIKGVGTWVNDNLWQPFKTALMQALGIQDDNGESEETKKLGKASVKGYKSGVNDKDEKENIKTSGKSWVEKLHEGITSEDMKTKIKQSGFDTLWQFMFGILDPGNLSNLISAGMELGARVILGIIRKIEDIKKKGKEFIAGFVKGLQDGSKEKKTTIGDVFKGMINAAISSINKGIDFINRAFNIKIGKNVAELASKLGFNVKAGSIQVFAIPHVPKLKIGTDMVKEEGLAYLHAGEKVVPADVVKGGYKGENNNNDETNRLLRILIETLDEKDFDVNIDADDIGKASVNYINRQRRIKGGSVI